MDMEQARYNMVEQQIRPWDVLNQAILDLLFKVRREAFVPEAPQALAFVDMEIPLGHGPTMLASSSSFSPARPRCCRTPSAAASSKTTTSSPSSARRR